MTPRSLRLPVLCCLVFAAGMVLRPPTGGAEEEPDESAARPFRRAPDPDERPGPDADLFRKAVAQQAKGSYVAARRTFWKLIDKFPESPYAPEAEDRSGPNAFLGLQPMGPIGASERRIDVALMGDGYRLEKQTRYRKHCRGQLDVLLKEQLYRVYRSYFNFWQFNLASEDKGVDEPEPPPADEELQERLRRRGRKKRGPKQYNTALDCKAAGPQGQVWANPRRVWHYLQYLEGHDSLAIVFAQMGRLGMGGMGIATTGPRGVVVHEFGHAFLGLLDEYAVNPGKPQGFVSGANATTSPDRPPWQHFLDAKVKGVGVFEGGATFKKGVWRPAASCAMNTSAGSPYCPVCREQGLLRIYERVSPIDVVWPPAPSVEFVAGTKAPGVFRVLPMKPSGHRLKVRWILGAAPQVTEPEAPEPEAPIGPGQEDLDPFEARLRRLRALKKGSKGKPQRGPRTPIGFRLNTKRRHRGTANDPLPPGRELKSRAKRIKGVGSVHEVVLPPDLAPGRHVLTLVVWDPAQPSGARRPWVLKDERGLLEDRRSWWITVTPAASDESDR